MSDILISKATSQDSRDIWMWRNDNLTREMSLSTDAVPWDSHHQWFEKSLLNKNRFLYVAFLKTDQSKVGMCRFDIDEEKKVAEVSVNLNPEKRGQSLSSKLLTESMKAFFVETKIDLVATIKKQNTASIKCFTKCGFQFDFEEGDCNHYIFRK